MSSSSGLGDLESEFGRVLSEQLDLLVAVSLFVVLGPFVNVSLTVLQHAMDESGEAVGHRRDGLWGHPAWCAGDGTGLRDSCGCGSERWQLAAVRWRRGLPHAANLGAAPCRR